MSDKEIKDKDLENITGGKRARTIEEQNTESPEFRAAKHHTDLR